MANNRYSRPVASLTSRKHNLQIFELPAKVGRNDKVVDVHIFHESISREHCLIEFINGRFTIRDLNSSAGTTVNSTVLEPGIPYYVEDGDKVILGKVKLRFKADFDELRRRMNVPAAVPSQPQKSHAAQNSMQDRYGMQEQPYMQNTDSPSFGGSGRRMITISARRLDMFEYDENEVVNIECGLHKTEKPLSYTQDLRKKELEQRATESFYMVEKENSRDEEDSIEGYTDAPEELPAAEESVPAREPSQDYTESPEPEQDSVPGTVEENAPANDLWDDSYDNEETMILTEEITAPPVPEIQLRWTDEDSGENGSLTVDKYPFNIGRKSAVNDYVILKKSASRRHMHFAEKDGVCFICDDGSSNGVRLNGERIEPDKDTVIKEGDIIRVARVSFTVEKIS